MGREKEWESEWSTEDGPNEESGTEEGEQSALDVDGKTKAGGVTVLSKKEGEGAGNGETEANGGTITEAKPMTEGTRLQTVEDEARC